MLRTLTPLIVSHAFPFAIPQHLVVSGFFLKSPRIHWVTIFQNRHYEFF